MELEKCYESAVRLFLKEWRKAQTTADRERAFSAFFIHATSLETESKQHEKERTMQHNENE